MTDLAASVAGLDDSVATEHDDGWRRSDLVGICLSVLCAVHCAAMPLLISMLPALGLGVFESPWVHQTLFVGCFALAMLAIQRGFRVHKRRRVPAVAVGGLALLAASAFVWPAPCCAADAQPQEGTSACCEAGCCKSVAGQVETPTKSEPQFIAGISSSSLSATGGWTDLWLRLMTPLGGVLLVVAHMMNLKFVKSCQCGCCSTA